MASEYDRKFEEMKNYIPFLESMIKRLESTSGSSNPRQAQLDKIRSLRDLLLDKKKRMKMENLLKCEQVLVNLYAKVEQRDTLPGIDLKIPTNTVTVKNEPDLDVVRNKLKIVTKLQEELPGTLPEIARANESQDTSTAGKEPALFQRRPNSGDPKNPPPKRNYTRVLVSPEPSPQRWSKHDDINNEQPLFSRRSPRRQSPTYHKKDKRQSKHGNLPKSKDLNITLKVPEEKLDSLNTSDIFSRIINCSDNDVDIATLRELRSQILGELKHTGAKDDISDLILNSSKKKKKKKSHKRKEEIEEGELSDSESEAIENIYGSLVIVDKEQCTSDSKTSNKQDQKPRKIQIRLVINSENEAGSSGSPSTSEKKGLVSDLSDVSEFEMFDKDLENKVKAANELVSKIVSKEKEIKLDDEIAPKASDLPDDDSLEKSEEGLPEKVNDSKKYNNNSESIIKQINDFKEISKPPEDKNSNDKFSFKPNFYKPLTEYEPENKEKQSKDESLKESKSLKENQDMINKTEFVSDSSSDKNESEIDKTVPVTNDPKIVVPNDSSEDVEIPLLNEPSVASHQPKESVVSEIDILQALKNEILSDSITIPGTDLTTPALHQPKVTKVANTQEIATKKRISIENYKQKATPKPVVKPLFTSQSSKDKEDQNKKQSLKLTEKECERFKIAISNDLSSDDDDIFDDLNKSADDDIDLAPKSPDNDDSNNVGNNTPVIIPADPVKNIIVSSKADVDMRTLMPILSPIATVPPSFKEVSSLNVTDKKQSFTKLEKNRPSDPRLKRDQTPLSIHNELPKPVPPTMLGLPIVASSVPGGVVPSLIPTLTPSPNMTPTITSIPGMSQIPAMTPNRVPNMTPIRAPSMTPSMTPNSRSYEIDDQPKRKHVYASLYDDLIEPQWETSDKCNQREPRREVAEDRDRNQHTLQDRISKNINNDHQKHNRYSDSRSYHREESLPMYRRTDAPMTPIHPFGRSDCPTTPSHPFGRSECPPTPSHPFGRTECPPTPSHPFGRLDCPPTPTHHFGRSEIPTSTHTFGRAECPMTPNHPFGRSECPPTPSHSFGRSECPPTPTHSFGRSEIPMTPSHPFGRIDRDPRLQKPTDYETNTPKEDRNRRYYNDQSSYKPSPSYNPKHDLNSKQYNDNYRNYKERSVDRPNYYKEQSGRSYNEERGRGRESSGHRPRNYDGDQYNAKGYKTDNEHYNTDRSSRFRDDARSNYQRESVGRTNSTEDRHVRSNSRARSVGRNLERDDENTMSVKPHAGRSFTIDTSVNSTFQDFMKSNKEKSIFDQLFERRSRASSVGRSLRESSVGRTLSRPTMINSENTNDRFRRARSVVRDTESKSLSEVKADFESYRSKSNVITNKINEAIQSKKHVERNSTHSFKTTDIPLRRLSDNKQSTQYSPRKNYRDPRLNRDPRHDPRLKQRENKHRHEDRDKRTHGIIYSNDNIASGAILGSGYGVKNYKIPKIKRTEEPPVNTAKPETIGNKPIEVKLSKVEKDIKGEGNIKNKEKEFEVKNINKQNETDIKNKDMESYHKNKVEKKERDIKSKAKEKDAKSDEQGSEQIVSVQSNIENSDKKLRRSNRISAVAEPKVSDNEVITKPRRTRWQIRESESESEDNSNRDRKELSEKEHKVSEDKKEDSKIDQGNNSLDNSFGMDDLGIFTDNATSDPIIDSINSLIADLDDDINTPKNESANKFTNEIFLENMLENISSQSMNEVSKDISIDSALNEINKLIGSNDNQDTEGTLLQNQEESLKIQIKENNKTSIKKTDNAKPSVNESCHKLDEPHMDSKSEISSKDADNIVSTSENITNEINEDEKKDQNNEQLLRSTTPDSTNTDPVPKESSQIDSLPDSTDEVHSEVSEVSSSNTSAQLLPKDPEPSSCLKETPAASDPLGNILSILQSKSKIKELLSMLGDQSSDNDKIKKKLEKLSEIVSDEEDQESRDGTEIDVKENDDEESKDCTEQDIIKRKDGEESKDCSEQDIIKQKDGEESKTETIEESTKNIRDTDKQDPEHKKDETNSLDNSAENIDVQSENTIATKKNKVVKKVPIKRKGKKGKFIKKTQNDDTKRVTRSEINVKKPVQPKKIKTSRELLKLQEDIKEMFISDDVLNVTGIRMCRLAKLVDDNNQKDVSAKSDAEPVVVLEKINKTDPLDEKPVEKTNKTKSSLMRKKPGPKSKVRISLNESCGDAEDKFENPKISQKYKPGPKSKRKTQNEPDPYEFETDSVNESNASKISEGSVRDTSDSESESLTSLTSFGSSEALSELKTLTEKKKKPKRKRSSWKSGVIKPKHKKKKLEPKATEPASKNQAVEEHGAIPDFNCFTDKKYCYLKNVFSYSCRLCTYNGEEIVAHYKKEHPHTEIPLSRLSPEVAKEAIEQCEEINFQAVSKIPTDKYVCRFCYKEFGKKKASLESFFWHVVSMHTGEYKQICSECVNITRCPFNLDIPPPPKDIKGQLIGYICGKCNFTQISLENLKTHVIVRHNDEQTEVYTINLAVMSRKIINLLSKRKSQPETDKPRVLRSSRSNQSMAEMSDDRSDATESNSLTEAESLKDEISLRGKKAKRKSSVESKSKLQSKITFENDDSDPSNTATSASEAPVKIEKDESDDENREEMTNALVELPIDETKSFVKPSVAKRQDGAVCNDFAHPHFKVKYTESETGIELMCFINDRDCHYQVQTLTAFQSHVRGEHKDEVWDGYCFICKDYVITGGGSFSDCFAHFYLKHMDNEVKSEVYFRVTYSDVGLKQFLCFVDGHDHYQCSSLISLKLHAGSHKGKWNGYCYDCKTLVKPKGSYFIDECLSHYLVAHNMSFEGGTASEIESTSQINSEASLLNEKPASSPISDIFAYPHFKVAYTATGSKEFVCCINLKDEIHYKTSLLISFKRHVQTKHSENWDGYCFVCKVIVMPQGRHSFKDCLQHFVDKHMDDFPVLEKQPEPEQPAEEEPPPPRPYINVRPLSQLKGDSGDLVLPKIESVVSLGATSAPTPGFSAPEIETQEPQPPEPVLPQPESEVEEYSNYEASQAKIMSLKHPVVQEAMLRKEKLVRVFKCAGSFCSFATDSADMALSHALTHQRIGGDNALFCCYCDFDCSGNAIDLVVHVFKHAICPYACGHCFYRAAAAQLVVAHSNAVHPGKAVKVYIANKATVPENNTANMLSREAVVQYYVCENDDTLCKFKTYTARKFCDHLQTRHPCSEHSCYICSLKYQSAPELIQHMKSHQLNLYQCTWCIHGADSEAELLAHAASRHPTQQPQAYLRIITNKEGSSEMRVLPLASFNKSSVGVEHVLSNTMPENPVKEAERSIDLQKLIGQTKLMFETITSQDNALESTPTTVTDPHVSTASITPAMDDMATIVPNLQTPANKTPPRTATPQTEMAEQITPILKSEPAEITLSKVPDEIVCLDSDEEEPSEQPAAPEAQPEAQPDNVIDISAEDSNKPGGKLIFDDDKVFKCPQCRCCCKSDTGLKLHILKCVSNWPKACPHCRKWTKNREVLIQHYISDHCKTYICGICNREMNSLRIAKNHFKIVHKINKVESKQTDTNVFIVNKEIAAPVPTKPMKRKLSLTNTSAPPPKLMKRYGPQDVDQLPINPILDDLVYCSLCEFNTKVRLNMVRHLQLHAESQPVPQTAPVNPVPHLETNEMHFDKMVNLASSSLAKDKTKEVGPLVSQLAPDAAARYPKFVPERQRYTCGAKDCSYISLDEAMLRCHWDTLHSGTADYRCVHCPPYQQLDKSKPLTAPRIMMHLKMHDTSLYACSMCTYYHFKRQIVEKHLNDAHKGTGQIMIVREEATGPVVPPTAPTAPTMDLKPWQCGLCSFMSMLRPEVVEHCFKNHQSKMQFKCAYCPFRTSTFENVVKHQANAHPGRPEEIFYYYYREGSVPDEDGSPKWVKQRQKMGITDDPIVKTEVSEGPAAKSDPPVDVSTPPVAVSAPVVVDLNIVKKEVEEKLPEGERSVEELCRKFGQFCEPNGLKYKCPLCTVVTEDSKEAMQSHLFEELQYRRWRCSICSYKAFHQNGLHEHISTEHRGRVQEPIPINLPSDPHIERWVAELLVHQAAGIDRNRQNLLGQKVQTPGPTGALNAPQKQPEKPVEPPTKMKFCPKELEDAFGQFGVANNTEYCCPKCVFRSEKEEAMREHLESELTKIRWCCSACTERFQNYHQAQFHCKSAHAGASARPQEASRDPHMRAAWVTTALNTQKRIITAHAISPLLKPAESLLKPLKPAESLLKPRDSSPKPIEPEKNMQNLVGQKVQRPTRVTTPQTPEKADVSDSKFNQKVLENAFGQFGVANNMELCCPKCVFRAKKEEVMKDHLEIELTKIRWCCSNCPDNFQTYHQAQFHCKSHVGQPARPREAPRDAAMRAAWVAAVLQVQKAGMKAATNENVDFSPSKRPEPEDSLLVVRYEEKVSIPEPSTSRPIQELSFSMPTPEPSTSRESREPSPTLESDDDEKLVIDEHCTLTKVGKLTICPYCPYQSKHRVLVKEHLYRHYGLYPHTCGYCEYTGYRQSITSHLETVHPHEPKKIKSTPLPKGQPTVANVQKRTRRKSHLNEWRFCLLCQITFNVEKSMTHMHGDRPGVFVKHGDIIVNCKVCQTYRKDFTLMKDHYETEHPDRAMNYFIYQILYSPTANEAMVPVFKRIPHMPSETIDINDDESPPKKVARKSTTKLPMQAVAKKSTTKLPCLYISEDEEYSYYGTKPTPLDHHENVTTLMPFCNIMMPFSVKKLSEILKIDPRVVVKDAKK